MEISSDARFPQTRKQRMCFHYYVDYYRCKELLGEDYNPCNYFSNVYKEVCPKPWVSHCNPDLDSNV